MQSPWFCANGDVKVILIGLGFLWRLALMLTWLSSSCTASMADFLVCLRQAQYGE